MLSRWIIASALAAGVPASGLAAQTIVPTRYVADRFYAAAVMPQGDTALLLMDTGGGGVFVIKPVLERLGIKARFAEIEEGDSSFDGGAFPAKQWSIPAPLGAFRG